MLKRIGWLQFLEEAQKKEDIICIGAGKRLQTLIQVLAEEKLINKIKYIADNDSNKQGTEVQVGEKNIPIQSVPSLLAVLNSGAIVIVTCVAYLDIIDQLNSFEKFKTHDIYALTHILGDYYDEIALKKAIPTNLKLSNHKLIPKTIHYCWFGQNPIPDRYKNWMESWKKYCPDYEIKEWNESNYDISKNPYMLQAYEQKKWGFVPDYARLDIIYTHGGIYLDTDVELIKNLDDLLYQKAFVGFESSQYVNLGIGFGAMPGNTFIKSMRDAYENYTFVDKQGRMNLTASPVYQTQFLKEHGLKLNGEYQILNDEITVYPEKMLSGKSLFSRTINPAAYTHAIHHFDGSWLGEDKRKMNIRIEKDMGNQ